MQRKYKSREKRKSSFFIGRCDCSSVSLVSNFCRAFISIQITVMDGQVKKSGGLGFDSSIVTHCRLDNSGLVTGINL